MEQDFIKLLARYISTLDLIALAEAHILSEKLLKREGVFDLVDKLKNETNK